MRLFCEMTWCAAAPTPARTSAGTGQRRCTSRPRTIIAANIHHTANHAGITCPGLTGPGLGSATSAAASAASNR
jgi:hypothetical protein